MSLVGGDLRIGNGLSPFEQSSGLSNGRDQMHPYVGSNVLIFGSIGKAIQVCHGDGQVGAWCLADLLISDHVKSIIEIMWGELSLLVRSSLGSVGVALFSLLSLFISFSVDNWFIVIDVENQISSSGRKDWEIGEPRRVWWQIYIVVFVLVVKTSVGIDPVLELVLLDLSSSRVRMETILMK